MATPVPVAQQTATEQYLLAQIALLKEQMSTAETDIQANLQAAKARDQALNSDMNAEWLILCGALGFFMQAGFAMLECGVVSKNNVINILFKNLVDNCVAGCNWWLFAYAFAYGETAGGFIGKTNFAISDMWDRSNIGKVSVSVSSGSPPNMHSASRNACLLAPGGAMLWLGFTPCNLPSRPSALAPQTSFTTRHPVSSQGQTLGWENFFFQWAFVATATTIVSGCVCERVITAVPPFSHLLDPSHPLGSHQCSLTCHDIFVSSHCLTCTSLLSWHAGAHPGLPGFVVCRICMDLPGGCSLGLGKRIHVEPTHGRSSKCCCITFLTLLILDMVGHTCALCASPGVGWEPVAHSVLTCHSPLYP
jgi:hypothetical protein